MTRTNRKWKIAILGMCLVAIVFLLSGCDVMGSLRTAGSHYEQEQVETPQNNGGNIDWSFVPVVRDMATKMFTEGAEGATITETAVVSKNGAKDRVIVIITYEKGGKEGTYGFDYTLENGEYVLKRFGEGVRSSDI